MLPSGLSLRVENRMTKPHAEREDYTITTGSESQMNSIFSGKQLEFGTAALVCCAVAVMHCSARGDGPAAAAVKVSQFASTADMLAAIDYFVGRLDQSLASKDAYDEAAQSRVVKEADTVAVLAVALSEDDAKDRFRGSTGQLLWAAQALSKAGGDYAAARKALDELKEAATGNTAGPAAAAGGWKGIAPLGLLMKEVPIVQSNM